MRLIKIFEIFEIFLGFMRFFQVIYPSQLGVFTRAGKD